MRRAARTPVLLAVALGLAVSLVARSANAGDRLLATGGATQIEGSAGGGVVPWAVLSGYGSDGEVGGSAFATRVHVDRFTLDAYGAAFSWNNRIELSVARQRLDAKPYDEVLRQVVLGAKVRLYGDLIYEGLLPQLSFGVQYKRLSDFELPRAVGARSRDGFDFYLSGTKLFLAGFLGRNVLVNATVRATRANQMGLLGFGGDRRSGYRALFEGSVALFLNRRTVIGYEFRQQPENLRALESDPWHVAFLGYFVNKHVAVVGAYTRLGTVASIDGQDGWYVSVQAGF